MGEGKNLENVHLEGEVAVNIEDADLDFERARHEALERAKTYDSDPMLIAWFDRKKGEQSSAVSCEGGGTERGWINCARGHEGTLTVNVNHGEYIFVFRQEHKWP
jgi:hypothetical protein